MGSRRIKSNSRRPPAFLSEFIIDNTAVPNVRAVTVELSRMMEKTAVAYERAYKSYHKCIEDMEKWQRRHKPLKSNGSLPCDPIERFEMK